MTTSAPTSKQMALLRKLATQKGVSFAWPESRSEASDEIEKLMKVRRPVGYDLRSEQDQAAEVAFATARATDFRDDEVTGYGSSAAWA